MKRISNSYVKQALQSVAMAEVAAFEALPSCPLVSSPQLTEKIERLARAQRRFTWRFVKTAKRRFVTALVALLLLFSLSLSISGVREAVYGFIVKTFATHTEFEADAQNNHNFPKSILHYHAPKWLPDGYVVINEQKTNISFEIDWQKDEQTIYYDQYLASATNFSVDTENADFTKQYINNTLTYVKIKHNTYDFWWIKDIYIYHLYCPANIEWENAVRIIESIESIE